MAYTGITTPLDASANNPNANYLGNPGTPAPTTNTPAINTSTPSPTNTNTSPNQVTANQQVAAKLGVAIPGQGGIITNEAQAMANKYKTGLTTAQSSGTPPPTSQGDANAAVTGITGGPTLPPPAPTPIESQMKNDPGFQQLLADHKDYLSVVNQQQTAQQTYDQIAAKVSLDYGQANGLAGINTQLLDWNTIINGSEKEISQEITAAGGTATHAQVMAMSAARNQVLTQNYNNLLQTKNNIVSQINADMNYAKEDKATAIATATEKLNFDKQISDYYQKFQTNAQSAYDAIIKAPGYGYQALLQSAGGDINTIKSIEQTLGLPAGGLAQLAQVPDASKTQVVKLDNGSTVLINSQTGQTIRNLGGAVPTGGPGTTDPTTQAWTAAVLGGNATMQQVPTAYRNAVALSLNDQPAQQYSPLAASRFATASNKIAANYINLPQYQLTANGLPYLQRIDAAMKNPGSVSDQDLLDSLTKLNTAGNAISDAQVKLITDGKSFSDMASTFANKFQNGGVLSANQRTQIQSIAKAIFSNYQKGYQPVYDKAVAQMNAAGIPKAFQNIPDLNNLSAQIDNGKYSANPPTPTIPPDIDALFTKNAIVNEGTKTITIPKSVWSTLGSNMDNVLQASQAKGYQLLVGN